MFVQEGCALNRCRSANPADNFVRKFGLKAARLSDLVQLGSMPTPTARFLEAVVLTGENIVVAGGTQTGKPAIRQDTWANFAGA